MADTIVDGKVQSLQEIRIRDCDFGPDARGGAVVLTATAVHIPPSGSPSVPVMGSISQNIVPVQTGPLFVLGMHTLVVVAVWDNGEVSVMRVMFVVEF